jgi:hypothetical protein
VKGAEKCALGKSHNGARQQAARGLPDQVKECLTEVGSQRERMPRGKDAVVDKRKSAELPCTSKEILDLPSQS